MSTPLPDSLTYGYVQGRYLLAVGDGPDESRLPDGRPATGMTVTFTPATVTHHLASPPTTVLRAPTPCEIGPDGHVREKDAADGTPGDEDEGGPLPGVWLIAGIYRVTFSGLSSHSLPKAFDIEVTPAHTEASPLWLTTAEPYIPPPGMVVQTVALPALTVDGDVLTVAAGEVAWATPTGGGGGGGTTDHAALSNRGAADQHPIGAITGLTEALDGKQAAGSYAAATHTHDDRYYTEGEVDTALAGKAASAHQHGIGDLTVTGTPSATTYLRGDGAWATPEGGGGASVESYTGPAAVVASSGSGAAQNKAIGDQPAGNRLVWIPVDLPACTVTSLAVEVKTAGNGSASVVFGIYADAGGGLRPAALLASPGSVPATSIGLQTLSGLTYAHPGGTMWVGVVAQGAAGTVPLIDSDTATRNVATTLVYNTLYPTLIAQDGVSGTLPTDPGGSAMTNVATRVVVGLAS